MKYLIIGTGGVGGTLAAKLAHRDRDVTVIARGEHLKAIQQNGLTLKKGIKTLNYKIPAFDMDHYNDQPDVIILGVKGYSLEDAIPFIERVAKDSTIVIPLLNIFGTGGELRKRFGDKPLALDGVIYITAQILEPGVILQNGEICRIVAGVDGFEDRQEELKEIAADMQECNIHFTVSQSSLQDTFKKFTFISPLAALSVYYDVDVAPIQVPGEQREAFVTLMEEVIAVGKAMGINVPVNTVKTNLNMLDELAPTASASLYRDVRAGRDSEIDGLVYEVVRLGDEYGVDTPMFDRVAGKFGFINE